AKRAQAKLIESLPDKTRQQAKAAIRRFVLDDGEIVFDKRLRAMARAVQARTIVRIRFATQMEQVIHPFRLEKAGKTWRVYDGLSKTALPLDSWGRLNISATRFPTGGQDRGAMPDL
ncbi:MAG: hypothetical protein AAGF56_05940, partial [Pseudomonadota bacterium]